MNCPKCQITELREHGSTVCHRCGSVVMLPWLNRAARHVYK